MDVFGMCIAFSHLGYAYGQIGRHTIEVLYYEKSILLGFKDDHIFFNLGMTYGETGRINEAIKAINKALDRDPDNQEYQQGLATACEEKRVRSIF
jgi:tetratricopeptide (TPR) repeat protein